MFLFLFIFLLLALALFKGFCLELKSFYPKEQCHLVALGMAFRETPGEAACIKHEPVFCLVSQYRFILTSCICRAIHLSPVPRHVSNLSPNRLPSFHSPFQVSRFLFAGGKLEREESRNWNVFLRLNEFHRIYERKRGALQAKNSFLKAHCKINLNTNTTITIFFGNNIVTY